MDVAPNSMEHRRCLSKRRRRPRPGLQHSVALQSGMDCKDARIVYRGEEKRKGGGRWSAAAEAEAEAEAEANSRVVTLSLRWALEFIAGASLSRALSLRRGQESVCIVG